MNEMVREIRSTRQQARKRYICCECGQEIPIGSFYLRVDVANGGITQDIKHEVCPKQ